MNESLAPLITTLGYAFKDMSLLEAALSHRSVGNQNYERLEFLGDSVLNCVISIELFRRHPKAKEGALSRIRASLVNGERLAELAKHFQLGDYVRLGIGELKSGGFQRKSILADSMEAIIGAIYLDADFAACQRCILQWFAPYFEKIGMAHIPKDAKTQLQEYLQAHKMPLPHYHITHVSGEAHQQVFRVQCHIEPALPTTEGVGSNRRQAEQIAAERMLQLLRQQTPEEKK